MSSRNPFPEAYVFTLPQNCDTEPYTKLFNDQRQRCHLQQYQKTTHISIVYLIFIQHELGVLGSGLRQEKEIIKYKQDWKKEIK